MTNYEKNKEVIIDILSKGLHLGLKKGKASPCEESACLVCEFEDESTDSSTDSKSCQRGRRNWLNAEADSTLTADERKLCELLKCGYIAQDANGEIFHFTSEPKRNDAGYWDAIGGVWTNLGEIFSGITFEGVDSVKTKAWRVADLLKLGVEE